ncbi:MAG: V-type ATP synthase subunit D [Oscillospiraceae bacterium]|jgi:V/A-type H+-transporting ATPase subunit D|nr:V-type ATP synthase subunit D [Oscillospiraceae bacterium]
MARLNVNPTRMELTRLKNRVRTARRGHKLLKDKRDELMKQFLDFMRRDRDLRRKTEEALGRFYGSFNVASALMSPEMLEQALLYPKQSAALTMKTRNIMSVNVPVYTFKTRNSDPADIAPYGYAATSGELDDALDALAEIFGDLLELAQIEKAVHLLAGEIEKTRRRVNALEYVMIPQLEETIRYISMKLDENERGNLTRLMKVKDMMLKQAGYGAE